MIETIKKERSKKPVDQVFLVFPKYMCVRPPLDKGFLPTVPPTTCSSRKGREDLQSSAQRSSLQDPRKRKLITSVYLLNGLHAVTPLFHGLFPWFLHDRPLNLSHHRLAAACAVQPTERVKQCLTFQVTGPFRLAVPSPSFPTWQLSH